MAFAVFDAVAQWYHLPYLLGHHVFELAPANAHQKSYAISVEVFPCSSTTVIAYLRRMLFINIPVVLLWEVILLQGLVR